MKKNKSFCVQTSTDCANSRGNMPLQQSWWCIFIPIGVPDCDCTKLILPSIALITYNMTGHVLFHTEMLQWPHQPAMYHV